MTDNEIAERMRTCRHRKACERMARIARLRVWYDGRGPTDACRAYAFYCESCACWEEKE